MTKNKGGEHDEVDRIDNLKVNQKNHLEAVRKKLLEGFDFMNRAYIDFKPLVTLKYTYQLCVGYFLNSVMYVYSCI